MLLLDELVGCNHWRDDEVGWAGYLAWKCFICSSKSLVTFSLCVPFFIPVHLILKINRIMSATIRDNIVFSHEYDEVFYKLVLEGALTFFNVNSIRRGD